jgi:His/Glu/Gln/Arg/opine family amino acid ABC transporter permease subunit
MNYTFHFGIVFQKLPYLLGGVLLTLRVMAISFILAFLVGLLVGALRLSKRRFYSIPAAAYVEVCRNTPALVQLIWIFYCLPLFTGIDIDPTTASIIALAINAGAYMAEDFRAGIQSVDKGQTEAARSLGMSHRQAMQKIVIPQALRVLIPPLVNHAVSLMKWSALVSVLGVADLTYRAQVLSTQTFRPLEIFTATGLVYLIMSMTLSYVVRTLERRWAMKY